MEDRIDELVQNQRVIAQLLAQQTGSNVRNVRNKVVRNIEQDRTVNADRDVDVENTRTVNQDVSLDKPNDQNTAKYFTTGISPITLSSTSDWERFYFGFIASTVNIRASDAIDVAFSDPSMGGGTATRLASSDLPFAIGGDNGIDSAYVWVRKASSASSDPDVRIIAYA